MINKEFGKTLAGLIQAFEILEQYTDMDEQVEMGDEWLSIACENQPMNNQELENLEYLGWIYDTNGHEWVLTS